MQPTRRLTGLHTFLWWGAVLWLALGTRVPASAAQSLQPALRVDGNPVVAVRPVTRVGVEWFVPLAPLAAALGADISINVLSQSIRVLRRDGVVVDYDSRTGQIRRGFVLLGEIKNFREVQVNTGVENLLFPLDGVVVLLGVAAHYDDDHDVIEVESAPALGGGGSSRAPAFQLASQDYAYSFASSGSTFGQFGQLHGQALLGNYRIADSVLVNQVPGSAFPQLRQGTVRLDLSERRVVTFGDQGTYSGLDALANTVRGIGLERPWGSFLGDISAGRAAGSVLAAFGSSGRATYDTTFAAASLRRQSKTSAVSIAGNLFRGTSRSGVSVGLAYSLEHASHHFKVQGVFGEFSGDSSRQILSPAEARSTLLAEAAGSLPPQGPQIAESVSETRTHVDGGAYGLAVTDSFAPFNNKLLLAGAWERYSRNFLTPRDDARFDAVSRSRVSVTLNPSRHVSLTGSVNDSESLLGSPDQSRGYSYGMNASAPTRLQMLVGYFRSVQTNENWSTDRTQYTTDLTQYTLQLPSLNRYAVNAFYTEFQVAGDLSRSVAAQVSADYGSKGRVGFHDQFQPHNTHQYGIDWSRQFGPKDAFVRVGVDRLEQAGQRTVLTPMVAGNLPLPWGQRLQITYITDRALRTFQVQIGGPLLRRRELVGGNGGLMTMIVPVSLGGQVYYDANLDERFEPGTDRPIADLQVWLDEERSTITDPSGYFRFNEVSPGTHRLRAGMATLPANLILRGGDARIVAAVPYAANRQDFSAIRAGQISGVVMVTSVTGTEQTPLNQPFPDARILATGGRDTFSEANGVYVLGDLPPGQYELHLDPAIVPAGFVVTPASRTVQVQPGQTLRNVDFGLARAVIQK